MATMLLTMATLVAPEVVVVVVVNNNINNTPEDEHRDASHTTRSDTIQVRNAFLCRHYVLLFCSVIYIGGLVNGMQLLMFSEQKSSMQTLN